MPVPSVKTLSKLTAPNPVEDHPKRIRKLLQEFDTGDRSRPLINPTYIEHILGVVNSFLDLYGVCHIPAGQGPKSPEIWYVNAGDPYKTTLMVVNGWYRVGCWGDIVERGNYA